MWRCCVSVNLKSTIQITDAKSHSDTDTQMPDTKLYGIESIEAISSFGNSSDHQDYPVAIKSEVRGAEVKMTKDMVECACGITVRIYSGCSRTAHKHELGSWRRIAVMRRSLWALAPRMVRDLSCPSCLSLGRIYRCMGCGSKLALHMLYNLSWLLRYHNENDSRLPDKFFCLDCRLKQDKNYDTLNRHGNIYQIILAKYKELCLLRLVKHCWHCALLWFPFFTGGVWRMPKNISPVLLRLSRSSSVSAEWNKALNLLTITLRRGGWCCWSNVEALTQWRFLITSPRSVDNCIHPSS